jgi:hypothetical protein
MNKLFVSLIVVTSFFHVDHLFAQHKDSLAMKYAATITPDELKEHLYYLASDTFKGRDTGSPELMRAGAYLAQQYQDQGIPPCVNGVSYFQEYPLKQVRYGESTIALNGVQYTFKKDFYTFGGFEAIDLNDAQCVFAGYGIEDAKYNDYAKIDVNGKVVMMLAGEPMDKAGNSIFTGNTVLSEWSDDFRKKRDLAKSKGAKAIMIIDPGFDFIIGRIGYFLDQPHMALDYPNAHSEDEVVLPYFFISPAMADSFLKANKKKSSADISKKIAAKRKPITFAFKKNASVKMAIEKQSFTSQNVLCFIEGSDPELRAEVVVISAHFDHVGEMNGKIYNGADDDGSGTVSAIEIAEAFIQAKKEGHGPMRSVLILHVSGEEKGLLGSEWYSEFPVFPLENTVCDLNIDMIGRVDDAHKDNDRYVYVIGSDKLSTQLHAISESANSTYTNLALDYTYNSPDDPNRFYYRSDHYNFAKHKIPVIFYFSGVHEDYHQPGDDPEKILYDKMSVIAKLVFHTAWEVANRKDRLVVDVESDFQD